MNQKEKILENRKRLQAKFGKTRIGGKGSIKRKFKVKAKTQTSDDKKIKGAIKRMEAQPIPDVIEVNIFKNDSSVIRFINPEVYASFPK